MATLVEELKVRGVTVYRIMKELGLNQSAYSRLSQKIKGNSNVRLEEIQAICQIVSRVSGKELTVSDVNYFPVWVQMASPDRAFAIKETEEEVEHAAPAELDPKLRELSKEAAFKEAAEAKDLV